MTIDTSREAVERVRAYIERRRKDRGADHEIVHGYDIGHSARPDGYMLNVSDMDALLAERDAALAEVARLSTPPDDAEVAELVGALGVKSAMIQLGEKIAWGSDTALMDEAADALTRLSALLRAEYERGVRDAAARMAEPSMLGLTITKMEQAILALLAQEKTE